jgi:heptosyltransferase I
VLDSPRSILVIKPSSLGDIVHTLPAAACVKHRWPEARVSWLVNPEWAPLLAGNPHLSDIIEFPRAEFGSALGWTKFPAWMRRLKERARPDLVLDFQGLLRSALIGRCSGGEVWGTSDSREGARWLHHHVVRVPPRNDPIHAVSRGLALVEAIGCPRPPQLEWPLPAGSAPRGLQTLSGFVLLHPFSRGSGKSISSSEVIAFCEKLAPQPVVLVGRSDADLPNFGHVANLLNQTTLPELCWLIRNATFTVSVDSGPMHIAAALTDRLLAIHTWSDPLRVGPYQPQAWIWKDGVIGRMAAFPDGTPCTREALPEWTAQRLSAPQ